MERGGLLTLRFPSGTRADRRPRFSPSCRIRFRKDAMATCIARAMRDEVTMKSATIPPPRVAPELRLTAESVLRDGESLSSFVEDSLRRQIEHRTLQSEFITRGLAARDCTKSTARFASRGEVMGSLQSSTHPSLRDDYH
jgi:hypothetical protein